MSNPLQLPEPNMRPGGFISPSPAAPDPISVFLGAFLEGQQNKRRGRTADAQIEEAKARTALAQGTLKLAQEREKTQQAGIAAETAKTDAQGSALQQMLKALSPAIEQHAQTHPEVVQGIMPQGGPQGQPQANGAPPAGPPQPQPMEIFSALVSKLPPGAVPDFVKNFRGVAEGAQQKLDEGTQFNEAQRLTKGLLTPEQRDQMMVAWHLQKAGAPKEMWESMLPTKMIDLAKGIEEVRAIKDKSQANIVATAQLQKLGLIPKTGLTQLVVDNAPKMLVDYLADVRKDARAADLVRAKENRERDVQGVKGTAMEIALANPDWSGAQIKKALRATPAYDNLPDGVLAQVALEAPKNAQGLTAPANETQSKIRTVYGPARAGFAVVNALDKKGVTIGVAARAAQTTSSGAGLGLGAALGTGGAAVGGPVGAVVGGLAGGAIGFAGAPLIRGAGRLAMSTDEERLWTAAQSVAAAVYRPESGAAVTPDEIRQTIERYFPLNTDGKQQKELKRTLRDELDRTLAANSGLPRELSQYVLNGLLSRQERELAGIGKPTIGGGSDF